jgi:aminoglycoside phosphotransferase (APT) family kinase protein
VIDPCAVLAGVGIGSDLDGAGCTATPVSGGWDTSIWRVRFPGAGGQDYALRLFRAGQEAACAREVAAMHAAGEAVPVPRVRLRGAWEGRPALLMDWAPGAPLLAALRARPWDSPLLGMAFGATQARLHRDAPLPPALDGQQRGWIEWAGDGEEALQARLRALPAQRTSDRRACLLHLDYHPLNVLVAGSSGRLAGRRAGRYAVSAVLDWANARPGDARADVARTLSILRLSPAPEGVPLPLVRALLAVLEAGWRRGYRRVAGDGAVLDSPDAPLFNAWAGAVMVRDLEPRLGRPGIPLREADFQRMRAWVRTWKARAGMGTA